MDSDRESRTVLLRITGRVQGVGYRAWTCEAARGLGLAGWVKNEADGAVLALAHGPEATLERFRAQLAEGPPHARVSGVAAEAVETPPGLSGFRIVW